MYSSWSNGRPLSAFERGSLCVLSACRMILLLSNLLPTHFEMRLPCLLTCIDHARVGIIQKLRVLPQPSPHAKSLARIVGLVDQVALLGIGRMLVAKRNGCPLPRASLEAVVLLEAKLYRFAE